VVSGALSVVVKARASCAISIVPQWLGVLLAMGRSCSGGVYALRESDGTYALTVTDIEDVHSSV
jgi:hypothetical protein